MPSNNKKEKNSNSNSPKPKTLKMVPIRKLLNEILNEQEKSKTKTRNSNSKSSPKKSKSLSPLPFKMRPKSNYHRTNVPNVIVQNKNRKKGGVVLNSLPNKFFRSNSNSNLNNENLTIKQLQEKYSKLQKKLVKLAPNNDGQIWIMEELLKLSLQISAKQKIKDRKKTMTSKINNLKGKNVVRRLNLTKK